MNEELPLRREWRIVGVVVFTLLGAMSAVLEILLVPLYIGSVIFPITLVIALLGNVALPRALRFIVGSTGLGALPFVAWAVVILLVGSYPDAMGDVLLPGYGQAQYVGGALLVIGLTSGAFSLFVKPRPRRSRPPTSTASR